MRGTVRFIGMATLRTFTGRVTGIDKGHRHACELRLVGQKHTELGEGPAMQNGTLRTPSPDPLANVGQFFQHNRLLRASGVLNDLLRDYVIRMCGETGLPARQFAQFALCAASLLLLQLGPQAAMAMPNALDGSAAVLLSSAGNGNLGNAQVHAQKAVNIDGFRLIYIAGCGEVEKALVQDQVRFPLAGFQQRNLARASFKPDLKATFYGPYRDSIGFPRQDAVIEGDRPVRPERPLHLLVQLVGIADFADASHGNLSGQPELIPRIGVSQLVQSELPEGLRLPCAGADPVAAGISRVERFGERREGFRRGGKFNLGGELHNSSIDNSGIQIQLKALRLKAGGIHHEVLI